MESVGNNVVKPGDYADKYGSKLSELNSSGKPLKAGVDYGDAPNTLNHERQPDLILAVGKEGPIGPATVENLEKVGYTTTKLKVI